MNTFLFLWEILITGIETVLMYYLFYKRIGRNHNRLKPAIGGVVVFAVMLLMDILFIPPPARICVNFTLSVGYAYLAFGKGRIAGILWGCIPGLITVISDTLAFNIAVFLHYGELAGAWRTGNVYFYISATYILLQIIIVLIAANAGKQDTYSLSPVQLVFLAGMSVVSIIAINMQLGVVYTLTSIIGTHAAQQDAVFVSLCFLIIVIALVLLMCSLGKESQKTMEKSLEVQQVQLENEYYKSLEISSKALRELRHDISTHMHVMKSLMDEEKTEELKEYFSSMENQYEKDNALFLTDNTMLNAMLTSKQMIAGNCGVKMRLNYTTKRLIPLSSVDFCSLMGNMIDNGIEACRKVMDENTRYIDISIGDKGDMVYIKVKNCSDGNYNLVNGELHTTKSSGRHGIGLKRIKKIAESAGGFFDVNPRPDEFTAVVMLPSIERRSSHA